MFRHKRQQPEICCPDPQHRQQFREKLRNLHDHHGRYSHRQFLRHYRYFRYLRPATMIFTLFILYLLFSWVGFKGIGLFFASVIIIKEIIQFFFLLRLEKRILAPMENLRQGLDEVARGNYNIRVEYDKPNDLGLLIASFNDMTAKMYESEQIQAEYENNRKALIANISHDLKTPITAIQGYIEALLDGTAAATEIRHKYLNTIHYNIIYVNKLIDDLFLFAKLDMQKLEFSFAAVNIRGFMDDLLEECKFELGERGIQVQYSVQLAEDCRVSLDGKRFHQAFNNIIGNAVQHGPEKGLCIEIRLGRQDDFIYMDIKDNGPGIAADKLPFIFDRFYRIESERPKNAANTGLGLAIAKELLEAHGGKIAVSSIKDHGSCFTLMLPVLHAGEEVPG